MASVAPMMPLAQASNAPESVPMAAPVATIATIAPAPAASVGAVASDATPELTEAGQGDDWNAIITRLGLSGAAAQLARNCVLLGYRDGVVRLGMDPGFGARTPMAEERLTQALTAYYDQTVKLEFTLESGRETPAQALERADQEELIAARQAFSDDPTVRALQERFGATLLPETIRPNRLSH